MSKRQMHLKEIGHVPDNAVYDKVLGVPSSGKIFLIEKFIILWFGFDLKLVVNH